MVCLTALITRARTGLADSCNWILDTKPTTGILTLSSSQVKILIRGHTFPSHHVEYIGLAPTKPTSVLDMPGPEHVDSKLSNTIDSFVDEFPLVLKATIGIDTLEGSDPHDEVVKKLDGDGEKAAFHIVEPSLEDDEVFFGLEDVIGIEDDFAEMHVGDHDTPIESDVPHVAVGINNFRIDVELQECPETTSDP